ncbi:hypothetical protein B0T25DRAFT_151739 [Lasiosphaeria hispida]|uniref:Uncharacterized protein n=1 Tax=Lasiosphaeria hispida TaxID=260671 RepID=A0AAJ0MFZ7_9PEZI|nr:hypothetical protein B0T25DRAFT_151739 [Lasiosphaeria hispida]
MRETIRQALYSPVCSFQPLAAAPAESVLGENHTTILASGGALCTRLAPTHVPLDCPWCSEATFGVLCGDSAAAAAQRVCSVSWAREEVGYLRKQSSTAGEPWGTHPADVRRVAVCAQGRFQRTIRELGATADPVESLRPCDAAGECVCAVAPLSWWCRSLMGTQRC